MRGPAGKEERLHACPILTFLPFKLLNITKKHVEE